MFSCRFDSSEEISQTSKFTSILSNGAVDRFLGIRAPQEASLQSLWQSLRS